MERGFWFLGQVSIAPRQNAHSSVDAQILQLKIQVLMTVYVQYIVQMESAFMMSLPIALKTGTLHTKHLQKDWNNLWAMPIMIGIVAN